MNIPDFSGNWQSSQIILYEEYPNNLAFQLINKKSLDTTRANIHIESSNKELRDALTQRFREIDLYGHLNNLLLHYFFGGQGAVIFSSLEKNPKPSYMPMDFDNFIYLEKLNSLTFMPQVNAPFFCMYKMENIFSNKFGNKYLNIGGTLIGEDKFHFLFENRRSQYDLIHPFCHTIEKLRQGVNAASHRLGILHAKKTNANSENPEDQLAIYRGLNDIHGLQNEDSIVSSINEDITNISLNMGGLEEASNFLWYSISALTGIPMNILIGKGQGASASAEEDNKTYSSQQRQAQELYCRPFIRKVIKYLTNEKIGIMKDFDPTDDVTFSFTNIIEESQLEKQQRIKLVLENMKTMKELGMSVEEASSIDVEISNIINNRAEENPNEKKGRENASRNDVV